VDELPGVSVVIPTYNRADLVEAAARSVLAQAWAPLEVVIVDDASSDCTSEQVARLAATDNRVRLVMLEDNRGASAARNRGVEEAVHPFVAFLDSDNTFLPEKLIRQMPGLINAPAGAVSFTAYTEAGERGGRPVSLPNWSPTPAAAISRLMLGCCINTSTFVAPRDVLLADGRFRTDLVCCEDHDLWLRLAAAGHSFVYCPEPLTRYRVHAGSLSADQVCVAESSERVIGEFLRRSDVPSAVRANRRMYQSRWALNTAAVYTAAGDGRKALGALGRGARLRPLAVRPGWGVLALRAARSAFQQS
jgi:glycosyltransferase involved in cell wall biosynthesis